MAKPIDTRCARIPVIEGKGLDLLRALPGALDAPGDGLHFARLVVLDRAPPHHLMLGVIYDGDRDAALTYLVSNATTLDAVFACCNGYPTNAAYNKQRLDAFLSNNEVVTEFLYPKYRWKAELIDESLHWRRCFLALLRSWQVQKDLPTAYAECLACIEQPPAPPPPTPVPKDPPPFEPNATHTLNMIHKLKPNTLKTFKQRLGMGQWMGDNSIDPLSSLHTLHFARISVINGDSMLFASAYDGDLKQYALDFGSRVGWQIDLLWGLTEGYPEGGCADIPGFFVWLEHGRYAAQAFRIGHHEATVLEIDASKRLRGELREFVAKNPAGTAPDELDKNLRRFVKKHQTLLA